MSEANLKCGVAGVGYLGQHHARLYREIEGVELAGIFETNEERAREIGKAISAQFFFAPELAKNCDTCALSCLRTSISKWRFPCLKYARL